MKTREEIITGMCYTARHDYGLDKHPDDAPFVAGMTQREREFLYKEMAQLFENNFGDIYEQYRQLLEGESVVLPKDEIHARSLIQVGAFYLEQHK
jgi:hypothetical protein